MNSVPTNSLVTPMLTDMYQISMAYAYWKNEKYNDSAVFDLFFRKSPFGGEYCIFAGLDEALKFLASFSFTASDVVYLKSVMPSCEPAFFDWLLTLDCSGVKMYAMQEGSVVFPREPLMRIEGPLAVVQLLETTLLNLINFPSLIATNAARMRLAAGPGKTLLEFGLRRAQGPDGGLSASKYAYMGGFNGTANVLAGKLFGITIKGTHAHSFVMSYTGLKDLNTTTTTMIPANGGEPVDFVDLVLKKRHLLGYERTNEGELAAFIGYALSFPNGFLALVDTYETLQSGVPNFLCVGWALHELGYKPLGIRLDSGDLAYLSREVRNMFRRFDAEHIHVAATTTSTGVNELFSKCNIVASNDINEEVLLSLNREGHEIDTFGIGTHLVTCQVQPALGCVYKLVEINGQPRIKLSQEIAKLVIPGKKCVYRLYGQDSKPLVDLMLLDHEPAPIPGERILVRHPFAENKRAYVSPSAVKAVLQLAFDGSLRKGKDVAGSSSCATTTESHSGILIDSSSYTLEQARAFCINELASLRNDHIRALNATPYKLSVSQTLFDFIHQLWMDEAPIADLK